MRQNRVWSILHAVLTGSQWLAGIVLALTGASLKADAARVQDWFPWAAMALQWSQSWAWITIPILTAYVALAQLAAPPFGPTIIDCIELLVQRIIDIESARGEIARAERSALDSKAQPLQDLLDHMIYRMAGLSEADITGLEDRLARML